MMQPSPQDSRRAVVTLILTALLLAGWAWSQIPPWEREHLRMVARSRARWVLGAAARRLAQTAMREELAAGRPETAAWRYHLTARLTRLSDRRGDTLP